MISLLQLHQAFTFLTVPVPLAVHRQAAIATPTCWLLVQFKRLRDVVRRATCTKRGKHKDWQSQAQWRRRLLQLQWLFGHRLLHADRKCARITSTHSVNGNKNDQSIAKHKLSAFTSGIGECRAKRSGTVELERSSNATFERQQSINGCGKSSNAGTTVHECATALGEPYTHEWSRSSKRQHKN